MDGICSGIRRRIYHTETQGKQKKTTLTVLVFELSPLQTSVPEPYSRTMWKYSLTNDLHNRVSFGKNRCHEQDGQLQLFQFVSYLPLLETKVWVIIPEPNGMYSANFTSVP